MFSETQVLRRHRNIERGSGLLRSPPLRSRYSLTKSSGNAGRALRPPPSTLSGPGPAGRWSPSGDYWSFSTDYPSTSASAPKTRTAGSAQRMSSCGASVMVGLSAGQPDVPVPRICFRSGSMTPSPDGTYLDHAIGVVSSRWSIEGSKSSSVGEVCGGKLRVLIV